MDTSLQNTWSPGNKGLPGAGRASPGPHIGEEARKISSLFLPGLLVRVCV